MWDVPVKDKPRELRLDQCQLPVPHKHGCHQDPCAGLTHPFGTRLNLGLSHFCAQAPYLWDYLLPWDPYPTTSSPPCSLRDGDCDNEPGAEPPSTDVLSLGRTDGPGRRLCSLTHWGSVFPQQAELIQRLQPGNKTRLYSFQARDLAKTPSLPPVLLRDSLAALPPPSLAAGNAGFTPSFLHVLLSPVSIIIHSSRGCVHQSVRISVVTFLSSVCCPEPLAVVGSGVCAPTSPRCQESSLKGHF